MATADTGRKIIRKRRTPEVSNPRREQRMRKQQEEQTKAEIKASRKMDGWGYWIIMLVGAIDDTLGDWGTGGTISNLIGWAYPFLLTGYMYISGVGLGTRNLVRLGTNFLIEIIPFVSLLPSNVWALWSIKKVANSKALQTALQAIPKK